MRGKLFRLILTVWFGIWAVDAQLPSGCAAGQGSMSMPGSMPMAMGGHHTAPDDDGAPPTRQQANQCHQHCSVQTSRAALHVPAISTSVGVATAIVASAPANPLRSRTES